MRLKNTSGGAVELPTLDLRVAVDDEVDVTGDDASNLLASGLFQRADSKPSKSSEKPDDK